MSEPDKKMSRKQGRLLVVGTMLLVLVVIFGFLLIVSNELTP